MLGKLVKAIAMVTVGSVAAAGLAAYSCAESVDDLTDSVEFSCRCGGVRGQARVGRSGPLRVVCHCDDCRKWGLLPMAGGGVAVTEQGRGGLGMLFVYKGGISLRPGSLDNVEVFKLYPDSLPLRYRAKCCDTSIGSCMPQPLPVFGLSVREQEQPAAWQPPPDAPRIHINLPEAVLQGDPAQLRARFPPATDTATAGVLDFLTAYVPMLGRGVLRLRSSPFPEQTDRVIFPDQRAFK